MTGTASAKSKGCFLPATQPAQHAGLSPAGMIMYGTGKRDKHLPRFEETSYSHRKFLTPEDEASIFTMDHFPLWYRQASEQPPGSFVFNLRWAEGPGNLHFCTLPQSGKWGQGDREERKSPGLPPCLPS